MEKKCKKCEVLKSYDEFTNDKRNKDGKQARCKDCITEDSRKYREELKRYKTNNMSTLEFIKLFNDNHALKKCTKCGEVKSLDDFCNAKHGKNGKASRCKDCDKEYYKNNREKLIKNAKAYSFKNKEKIVEYRKDYFQKNKDELWRKLKIKINSDSILKLSYNIRHLICVSIRRQGYTKNTKTFNILKCDYDFFMQWLNGLASNGHTYGIGELHLDHVIPISLAQTEDELYLLNHYSNFQLLSADENQSKGNRYVSPTNLKRVLEHHPNPDKIREIHARL